MDEQVILGNFVDEIYYKQCNHEGSDINKSPLLMSKSTSNMYHEGYNKPVGFFLHNDADFNPRTHEGYDVKTPEKRIIPDISIHVPTKGTTNPPDRIASLEGISIHVPTKGTTVMTSPSTHVFFISIHVPTKGTTSSIGSPSCRHSNFNPRTHKGYDGKFFCLHPPFRIFQSTYPQRVRQQKYTIIFPLSC